MYLFILKILFINAHFAYLRTWKLLQLFIYLIGPVAHINVPSVETFVLYMKALMSKFIQ